MAIAPRFSRFRSQERVPPPSVATDHGFEQEAEGRSGHRGICRDGSERIGRKRPGNRNDAARLGEFSVLFKREFANHMGICEAGSPLEATPLKCGILVYGFR